MFMEIPVFKVEWNRTAAFHGYSLRVSKTELDAFVKVLLFNGIKHIEITEERESTRDIRLNPHLNPLPPVSTLMQSDADRANLTGHGSDGEAQ